MSGQFEHGLVIGKFHPFHRGHSHLIDTAEAQCERVTAIVCGRQSDAVRPERRAEWIRTIHPAVDVLVIDEDDVQLADDDSRGWATATEHALDGGRPDAVFTSEDYGDAYAAFLGCEHVLVDRERSVVPISGSAIRADPLAHLGALHPTVRAHYVLRVCLLGAESTGKTTLAAALAQAYGTVWAPEYGHLYQALARDDPNGAWSSEEFVRIARMQRWLEDFQASQASRVLFCDTDTFTTGLWHEAFLGTPPPEEVDRLTAESRYDLFVLCSDDIPFRQDAYVLREDGPRREWMQRRYAERLESGSTPWVRVSGPLAARIRQASHAVDELTLSG
ncbi:MAG: HTH-type transcriptional regulator, transcriptional repressor of biosynthesis s [Gaiellaceae bacterium]|nr:HTH-type transcriptional regulator, transcriptional repressor of biosynthesis s [Gaiellaceae bacterium]